MSQPKDFKFVFFHKDSYCKQDLVLGSECREEEALSKCSQLEKGSFHYVLGSLIVTNEEGVNDKDNGEDKAKKMSKSPPGILLGSGGVVNQEF